MMKASRLVMSCWITLLLALTTVSAVQKLKTINDLKKINFGQSVPSHTLLLLYWFANEVDVDNNDVLRVTFNPNNGDYGSHHYGNYERLLEPLPQGNIRYRYYTVGNLNQERTSMQLPSYVVHPQNGFEGRNRDRIIFRVREQSVEWQDGQIVDRVYITQHYATSDNQGTRYDPEHTYQVISSLISQIRQFSAERSDTNLLMNLRDRFGSNADDAQLRYIRISWGNLACLGLLLFIVMQEKYITGHHNRRPSQPKRNTSPDFVINIPESRQNYLSQVIVSFPQDQRDEIKLQVTTGPNGKASIFWDNVPKNDLKEGVMVVLYKNNEDQEALTYKSIGNMKCGIYKTSVPLNEGLQARLHKVRIVYCCWSATGLEIYRGEEFKNPTAVSIRGYNKAWLQLFAKNGKACARLYVQKSFSDWRAKFKDSWVGFYSSADKATMNYEWWQWQWATRLSQNRDFQDSSYDVFEYQSGMAIAPGVQARFILKDETVQACTPCWKDD